MALSSLKRRSSGGGQTRSDGSPTMRLDPASTSSSRTQTNLDTDRRAAHVDPVQHTREIRQPSVELCPAETAAVMPDATKSGRTGVNKSSWGWAQKTWSFLAPEGFEAFNVVRRAADGIASTATAMATTLDTTVEQLFEGWTPAPPASDHTPPLRPQMHRHNRKAAAQHSQAEHTATSIDVDGCHASQTDGWDDWGSSFGSRSPSPDALPSQPAVCSQQQSSIAAWPAAESGAQQQCQQQQTHAAALCGMSASGASSDRQQASSPGKENACPTGAREAVPAAEGQASAISEDCRHSTSNPNFSTSSLSRQHTGAPLADHTTANRSSSPLSPQQQCQQAQQSEANSPERDPLADQMAGQLQALLAEKARLAQENDRLARENNGLQELLQYTMHHHLPDSAESLEDWARLESALPQEGLLPSIENAYPLVSPR